jgi:hypothetical protein
MDSVVDMGSCTIPLSTLARLPVSFYSDVLGEDVAEEISTGGKIDEGLLSEVIPTLPKDMKELLASKVKETGA